jgi:hypothetical protein
VQRFVTYWLLFHVKIKPSVERAKTFLSPTWRPSALQNTENYKTGAFSRRENRRGLKFLNFPRVTQEHFKIEHFETTEN